MSALNPPVEAITYDGLDTRLDAVESGGRTAVTQEAPLNVEWPEYGAVADGSADDTAAVQAALDAMPAEGGTLLIPGVCKVTSALNADDTRSVILQGIGGQSGGATTKSRLLYTGTGTMLSAKSSIGFGARDLWLQFDNASHSGTLIDLAQSAAATDSQLVSFERCQIGSGGSAVQGTGILVSLDKALNVTFLECNISGGNIGVRGRSAAGT